MRELLLVLLIASCGGKAKPAAEPPPPPAEAPIENRVAEEEPPPAEAPIENAGLSSETGVPECDEYLRVMEQLMVRCEKQLGPAMDAMRQSIDAQRTVFAEWKQKDPAAHAAELESAKTGCAAATDAIHEAFKPLNCL